MPSVAKNLCLNKKPSSVGILFSFIFFGLPCRAGEFVFSELTWLYNQVKLSVNQIHGIYYIKKPSPVSTFKL